MKNLEYTRYMKNKMYKIIWQFLCCVLLPMKLLAYGNSSCAFCDYFSMNNEMTCQYCINFEEVL